MGTVFAVSTKLSHLISVPDACRIAENGLHVKFSWQDMKEGDHFASVHVVEGIILKLRQRWPAVVIAVMNPGSVKYAEYLYFLSTAIFTGRTLLHVLSWWINCSWLDVCVWSSVRLACLCHFRCLLMCKKFNFLFYLTSAAHKYSWRMKDQLDVTCYFISLLMCSTCFGH